MIMTNRQLSAVLLTTSLLASSAVIADTTVGDPQLGKQVWESRCSTCHALDSNVVGPRHRGVYGRIAGKVADFNYSAALKSATFTWNDDTLDKWLTDPEAFVAGQKMYYKVANPVARANVIAYLKSLSTP